MCNFGNRTQLQGIQTDSGRIQLNTPRIQDSRFKVQGKLLPGTLNLESEAYSIEYALNPFEYGPLWSMHLQSSIFDPGRYWIQYPSIGSNTRVLNFNTGPGQKFKYPLEGTTL